MDFLFLRDSCDINSNARCKLKITRFKKPENLFKKLRKLSS